MMGIKSWGFGSRSIRFGGFDSGPIYRSISIDRRNDDLSQSLELDFIGALFEARSEFLSGGRLRRVFKHDGVA